jgi:hypothetical protein
VVVDQSLFRNCLEETNSCLLSWSVDFRISRKAKVGWSP